MPRFAIYGYNRQTITVPVAILSLQGTAAAVLTSWTPGFAFEVEKVDYLVKVAHTGSNATRAFTLKRGATAVAVITPTVAATGTVGAVVAQTSLTPSVARFSSTDAMTIDFATGTAFTAGEGSLLITVRLKAQQAY